MVANDQQPQQVAGNAQRPLAPPGVLRRLDNFISTRPRLVDCLAAIMGFEPTGWPHIISTVLYVWILRPVGEWALQTFILLPVRVAVWLALWLIGLQAVASPLLVLLVPSLVWWLRRDLALYHSYLTAANAYIAVTAVCNLSPLRSFLAAAATYEDLVRSGATADDMRDARELRLKNAALEADNERLKAEANLPAYQE
ncbi:hypothetical protein JCM10213v2_007206 [Rhodosporidiobolus nylandii]